MLLNKFYQPLITCLIITIIIELLIACLFKIRHKKDFLNIILVNVITNPIVVFFPYIIYLYYGIRAHNISLIILELLAFITEGFIYKKVLNYKKINSYLISLILNLSSYFLGNIINQLIY